MPSALASLQTENIALSPKTTTVLKLPLFFCSSPSLSFFRTFSSFLAFFMVAAHNQIGISIFYFHSQTDITKLSKESIVEAITCATSKTWSIELWESLKPTGLQQIQNGVQIFMDLCEYS